MIGTRLRVALLAALSLVPIRPAAGAVDGLAARGLTVLRAASSASATLRLERPATLRLDQLGRSPDIVVLGAGRYFGFTLVRVDAPDQAVVAMRIGACDRPGCRPDPRTVEEYVTVFGLPVTDSAAGKRVQLPAGRYRWHAIADGAPIEARVTGLGRAGTAVLRATTRPSTLVQQSGPAVPAPVQPAFSAGLSAAVPAPAFLFTLLRFRAQPHLQGAAGLCYYLNSRPAGGYNLPPCLGSASGNHFTVGFTSLDYRSYIFGFALTRTAGDWYQGAYYDSVSGLADGELIALWLPLRA